jgi:hypothetical protein
MRSINALFTQVQQQLTANDSPHSRSMDVNLARISATVTEYPPIFPTAAFLSGSDDGRNQRTRLRAGLRRATVLGFAAVVGSPISTGEKI